LTDDVVIPKFKVGKTDKYQRLRDPKAELEPDIFTINFRMDSL